MQYGVGNYFAPDPRLSDFFIRDQRGNHDGLKQIILAQVAMGRIGDKDAIAYSDMHTLKEPRHRNAPDGYQSASSIERIEGIVYDNSAAFPGPIIRARVRVRLGYEPGAGRPCQIAVR